MFVFYVSSFGETLKEFRYARACLHDRKHMLESQVFLLFLIFLFSLFFVLFGATFYPINFDLLELKILSRSGVAENVFAGQSQNALQFTFFFLSVPTRSNEWLLIKNC